MQYLVGLKYFQEEQIFSPELFVTVRKSIDEKFFNDIILSMHWKQVKETEASDKEDDSAGGSHAASSQKTNHKGKMKIDATCTDAEVRYPTDINMLEDCSRVIDRLTRYSHCIKGCPLRIVRLSFCETSVECAILRDCLLEHLGRF